MLFRKKVKTHPENYPSYISEQEIIEKEIQTVDALRPIVGGSMLQAVLTRLPDDMIVNCHFHEYIHDNYRRVTVTYCKTNIPEYQKNRVVTHVRLDRLYDGSADNFRPIAVLEIPMPERRS